MHFLMICFLGARRSARNRVAVRYLNNGFVYSENRLLFFMRERNRIHMQSIKA